MNTCHRGKKNIDYFTMELENFEPAKGVCDVDTKIRVKAVLV